MSEHSGPASPGGMVWDTSRVPSAAQRPDVPGFEVGELLGAGGMGRVYRAVDRSCGRVVAIKVLSAARLTAQTVARFEREAELLARFRHPSVMAIHSWGRCDSGSYLVCEFVEGRHIDEVARGLPLAARLDLIEQAALAVGALHEAGVLHRDVKPSNFLVEPQGQVKLIDLGVSTGEGVERLTATGQILGTPVYLPPERFEGGFKETPAVDVWGLGTIAYELLAGERPFGGGTLMQYVSRCQAAPPNVRRVNPQVSPAVAAEVSRALHPKPSQRHQDANAFAAALAVARTAKAGWHPATLAGVAVVAALVALGLGLSRLQRDPQPRPAATSSARPGPSPMASAEAGDWEAVRAALRGRASLGSPERRLRELATLYLEGPERVDPAVLSSSSPPVVHERERLEAVKALKGAEPDVEALLEGCVDLARLADFCEPRRDVAGVEAVRRTRAWVTELLLHFAHVDPPLEAWIEPASRAAKAAQDLSGPAAGAVTVAHALALHSLDVKNPFRPYAVEAIALLGAGIDESLADDKGLAPELRAVACQLHFIRRSTVDASWRTDEALNARGEASLDLPRLPGLGPEHLRRLTCVLLAHHYRDRATAAYRQGELAEGQRLAARALRHARERLGLALQIPFTEHGIYLHGTIELLAGEPDAAREVFAIATDAWREFYLLECDLVAGDLAAAGERLSALESTEEGELLGIPYQRIHWLLLSGRIERAEALERTAAASTSLDRASSSMWVEWRSAAGQPDVLRGGWWPGRGRGD